MTKLLLPYLAIVVTMMVLDVIWIGGIARPLYNKRHRPPDGRAAQFRGGRGRSTCCSPSA